MQRKAIEVIIRIEENLATTFLIIILPPQKISSAEVIFMSENALIQFDDNK